MQIITDISSYNPKEEFAVTIGNFDGVHIGHQRLIDKLLSVSTENNLKSGILTFNPHPLKYFSNDIKLINTNEQKLKIFDSFNINTAFMMEFNETIAGIDPEIFIREYLIKKLKAKYIIVGYDYHFGKKRKGNFVLLQELSKRYDFTPIRIPRVTRETKTVSSTNIRKYIDNGEMQEAAEMLGRNYSIIGTVIRGDGIASKIGFPTANVHPDNELMPPAGVYATSTTVAGVEYKSVTYFGNRPTFNGMDLYRVETNIFNFSQNLYGEKIEVYIHKKLRGEMKFNGVEALTHQIKLDVDNAKEFFGENK